MSDFGDAGRDWARTLSAGPKGVKEPEAARRLRHGLRQVAPSAQALPAEPETLRNR